jgi:hypothetical protein
MSGVSEGAALAVLAASDAANHGWIDGVITMGLPATAELAWRWTDVGSWITKRDSDEPEFAPKDVIATVTPLPLYMIQSTKDEYVPKAEWELLLATAREPKKQILIDASNHRFTDKRPELGAAYTAGPAWTQAAQEESLMEQPRWRARPVVDAVSADYRGHAGALHRVPRAAGGCAAFTHEACGILRRCRPAPHAARRHHDP